MYIWTSNLQNCLQFWLQVFKILLFILYFLCKALFALLRILQFLGKSVTEEFSLIECYYESLNISELYLFNFVKNYLDAGPLTWTGFHIIFIPFFTFQSLCLSKGRIKVSLSKFYGIGAWIPYLNQCIDFSKILGIVNQRNLTVFSVLAPIPIWPISVDGDLFLWYPVKY